jgi:transcription initiation factor TFIIIB Brf1 subunit/transcription initiation factor TFIIB
MNTRKQLDKLNGQALNGGTIFAPLVLQETTELYGMVQQHHVRRGRERLGAMAACLAIVCNNHGISKKPRELAAFVQVDEKHVSNGDKLLREMQSRGELTIDINFDPSLAFISQNFTMMEVDFKWTQCAMDVIARADGRDMRGENHSRSSTKCAALTYLLGKQLGLPYSRDDIAKKCKISHATFAKYYEYLLRNRKRINPVLRAHGVPTMHRAVARRAPVLRAPP